MQNKEGCPGCIFIRNGLCASRIEQANAGIKPDQIKIPDKASTTEGDAAGILDLCSVAEDKQAQSGCSGYFGSEAFEMANAG